MGITADGIQELIDALETSFSNAEIEKMQQKALKPIAEEIKQDMKKTAPVCDIPEIHGRDIIGLRYVKSNGYKIGLDNQMPDTTGDYWETARSLWFSQYGSIRNNQHIGWFTNLINSNSDRYLEDARENLGEALMKALNK